MIDRLMSAIEEIHLIELEQGWDDEPGCEYTHTKTICTGHVTHRASCCVNSILLCEVGAEMVGRQLARGTIACVDCRRLVSDCWRVIPA